MRGDLLTAADLRPLTDERLLLLAARMAQRIEPWCPLGAGAAWAEAVELLVAAGNGDPPPTVHVQRLGRALMDAGARGTYAGGPEHVARGRNQAGCAVAIGLEAIGLLARKDRWKRVRDMGKHAASIYAVQAHAGVLAIADATTMPWAAARADVPLLARASLPIRAASLLALAPVWPGGEPPWARPPG